MRLPLWCLTGGVLLLTACSGYAPTAEMAGWNSDQVVARMGPPETTRRIDGGARLEFPRGPYGLHTWFVDLDASGRVVRTEQVLTEAHFMQINPGMSADEALQKLGRPGEVQGLGRSRGSYWSYRYENPFCRWFQVEITQEQTVRSAGYGEPPECRKRDQSFSP